MCMYGGHKYEVFMSNPVWGGGGEVCTDVYADTDANANNAQSMIV